MRLPKMSAKSPVPAPSAAKQAQTSGHLLGQACRRQRKSERSHEAQDRQRTRTRDDHPTLCHGGAGVWKRTRQQEDEPLYLARGEKSRRAVEALLHGTEHREIGAPRVLHNEREAFLGAWLLSGCNCVALMRARSATRTKQPDAAMMMSMATCKRIFRRPRYARASPVRACHRAGEPRGAE